MFHLVNIVHAGVISDAPRAESLLINILTFLLQVAGIIGIISLVVSGAMIYFSGGDPELAKKGKKGMVYSVVGIVVVLGALMILRTMSGVL